MPITKTQDELRIELEKIKELDEKIATGTEKIRALQGEIVNQIPNVSDWNKVMKQLNEVVLDLDNGATIVLQGVQTGEKLLKQTLPGIKFRE